MLKLDNTEITDVFMDGTRMNSVNIDGTNVYQMYETGYNGNLVFTQTSLEPNYCSVKGNTNISGDVVIPYRIKKDGHIYIVNSIPNNGFSNCNKMSSIQIPNNITSIGANAFSNTYPATLKCQPSSRPGNWNQGWIDGDYDANGICTAGTRPGTRQSISSLRPSKQTLSFPKNISLTLTRGSHPQQGTIYQVTGSFVWNGNANPTDHHFYIKANGTTIHDQRNDGMWWGDKSMSFTTKLFKSSDFYNISIVFGYSCSYGSAVVESNSATRTWKAYRRTIWGA